jgi:hypothetical protein
MLISCQLNTTSPLEVKSVLLHEEVKVPFLLLHLATEDIIISSSSISWGEDPEEGY